MELELESLFSIKLLLKRRGLNFNSFTFSTIFSALNFTQRAILGNVSQGISGTHVLYGKGKYWHQRTAHCCFTKANIFQPFGCSLFEHFFVYKYSFKLYFYEKRNYFKRIILLDWQDMVTYWTGNLLTNVQILGKFLRASLQIFFKIVQLMAQFIYFFNDKHKFNFPVRKSSTHQAGMGIKQIFKDCTFWLLEKSDKRGSNFPTQKKAWYFLFGDFFPTS